MFRLQDVIECAQNRSDLGSLVIAEAAGNNFQDIIMSVL